MLDDEQLTFIEVRARRSVRFTRPALTVDWRKQRKIVATAALFVARHPHFANRTMRFDVVSIEGGGRARIRWLRDAFRPDDSAL